MMPIQRSPAMRVDAAASPRPKSVERETLLARINERHAEAKSDVMEGYRLPTKQAAEARWEQQLQNPRSLERRLEALVDESLRAWQGPIATKILESSGEQNIPKSVVEVAQDVQAYRAYQGLKSHAISAAGAHLGVQLVGGRNQKLGGWIGQIAVLPISAPAYWVECARDKVHPSYGSKSFLRAWKDIRATKPECLEDDSREGNRHEVS